MISDYIKDNGLSALVADCDLITICKGDPGTSYSDASTEAGSGGNRFGSVAPDLSLADGAVDGRRALNAAVTGGTIEDDEATGTDQWWACLDTANNRVLSTGPIANDQVATDGNSFSLGAFDAAVFRD